MWAPHRPPGWQSAKDACRRVMVALPLEPSRLGSKSLPAAFQPLMFSNTPRLPRSGPASTASQPGVARWPTTNTGPGSRDRTVNRAVIMHHLTGRRQLRAVLGDPVEPEAAPEGRNEPESAPESVRVTELRAVLQALMRLYSCAQARCAARAISKGQHSRTNEFTSPETGVAISKGQH